MSNSFITEVNILLTTLEYCVGRGKELKKGGVIIERNSID
jgi:hypothetical protein